MVQAVHDVPRVLLGPLARLHVLLPLVECLGDDVEVGIFEEQSHHSPLHVGPLGLALFGQELVDVLGRVPGLNQLLTKSLGVSLSLVPLENNITFSIDELCQVDSLNVVSPLMQVMLSSVLNNMDHGSSKILLLEVF